MRNGLIEIIIEKGSEDYTQIENLLIISKESDAELLTRISNIQVLVGLNRIELENAVIANIQNTTDEQLEDLLS